MSTSDKQRQLNLIHRYRYEAARTAKGAKLRGDADRHAEYIELCQDLNAAERSLELGGVWNVARTIDRAATKLGRD